MLNSVQKQDIDDLVGASPSLNVPASSKDPPLIKRNTFNTPAPIKGPENFPKTTAKKPREGKQNQRSLILAPKQKPPLPESTSPCLTRSGKLIWH